MQIRLRSVAALMHYALLVKETPRTGWNKKFPRGHKYRSRSVKNAESSADHMYGLAFLAMLVADAFKVDRLKLIEMALSHDIVEALATDLVTATEEGVLRTKLQRAKTRGERKAINAIACQGGALGKRIKKLWEEYEGGKTPAARLLHQLDKLEACFQAVRYHNQRQKLNPFEFITAGKQYIIDPKLRSLLSDLERQCREL
jgi:putative hydrolases of HD superfamily